MFVHMYECLRRPKQGIRPPGARVPEGARVPGSQKAPGAGAENQTLVF